jgi:hypothetical protein
MALREFADDAGRQWKVWDSRPGKPQPNSAEARYLTAQGGENAKRFTPGRGEGWLTFTSDTERRRLSPIPTDWERADDTALRRYLVSADAVPTNAGLVGFAKRTDDESRNA